MVRDSTIAGHAGATCLARSPYRCHRAAGPTALQTSFTFCKLGSLRLCPQRGGQAHAIRSACLHLRHKPGPAQLVRRPERWRPIAFGRPSRWGVEASAQGGNSAKKGRQWAWTPSQEKRVEQGSAPSWIDWAGSSPTNRSRLPVQPRVLALVARSKRKLCTLRRASPRCPGHPVSYIPGPQVVITPGLGDPAHGV